MSCVSYDCNLCTCCHSFISHLLLTDTPPNVSSVNDCILSSQIGVRFRSRPIDCHIIKLSTLIKVNTCRHTHSHTATYNRRNGMYTHRPIDRSIATALRKNSKTLAHTVVHVTYNPNTGKMNTKSSCNSSVSHVHFTLVPSAASIDNVNTDPPVFVMHQSTENTTEQPSREADRAWITLA